MKETNSVFDILLFNEKHYLIERIGPFVEGYDEVVALGYSRLSEKKPGRPEPAYFTIEKKFMPILNQTDDLLYNEDVKYKSTLKNVVQDEDHIQFDFELAPVDVPPKNNEKDLRIVQLEGRVAILENQTKQKDWLIAQLEARVSILESQI